MALLLGERALNFWVWKPAHMWIMALKAASQARRLQPIKNFNDYPLFGFGLYQGVSMVAIISLSKIAIPKCLRLNL